MTVSTVAPVAAALHSAKDSLKTFFSRLHPVNDEEIARTVAYLRAALESLIEAKNNVKSSVTTQDLADLFAEFNRIEQDLHTVNSRKHQRKVLNDAEQFRRRVLGLRSSIRFQHVLEVERMPDFKVEETCEDTETLVGVEMVDALEKPRKDGNIIILRDSPLSSLISRLDADSQFPSSSSDDAKGAGLRMGPMPKYWFEDPVSLQFKFNTLLDHIPAQELSSGKVCVFAYNAEDRYIYVEFPNLVARYSFSDNWYAMPPVGFESVRIEKVTF
jgi:hypothetical protein